MQTLDAIVPMPPTSMELNVNHVLHNALHVLTQHIVRPVMKSEP